MMNTYYRTFTFCIDGVKTKADCWKVICEEEEAFTGDRVQELHGNTFNSLWICMEDWGLIIPANCWKHGFLSKKRRIEFFTKTKTWVDNGTKREWQLICEDKPATFRLADMMNFDVDKVIKYYHDRGITQIDGKGVTLKI